MFWRKWTGLLPELLAGVQVGLVAAGTRVHAVVAHQVGGAADALTQSQRAAVHFEDVVVQQLVQDGCKRRTQSEQSPVLLEWLNHSNRTGLCFDIKNIPLVWSDEAESLTLAERGVLQVADGINAVVVIPVQETQPHLRHKHKHDVRRPQRHSEEVLQNISTPAGFNKLRLTEFTSSSSLSADAWSLRTCRNCLKVFMIIYRLTLTFYYFKKQET